jgi:hypothetical protein
LIITKNLLYFKVMIRIEIAVNMKNFGFDGMVLQFVAAQSNAFSSLLRNNQD